jgi:ppGpp synthetase/RelA/SpoT-type nucleotidyltranferase
MSDELSKAALKRLGGRLRTAVSTSDLGLLDQYRRRFDPSLVGMNAKLVVEISSNKVDALVTGRIKRTKSIVRKLLREPSMDLSRMADIAGLRVIVRKMSEQGPLTEIISKQVENPRVSDRRSEEDGYRAVHITGTHHSLPIEIQLRSVPQQLWANESESLGEQVKEGGGLANEREYLDELSRAIFKYENGHDEAQKELYHHLARARRPFDYRLKWLERKFDEAVGTIQTKEVRSELLVYDGRTSDIVKALSFSASERAEAVGEFEYLSRTLDPIRFDVLILNSTSFAGLCVTHPRFYL